MSKALCRKIEEAFEAYFATQDLPECNVYRGVSNQAKEGPAVIIVAKGGPEFPLKSGNYKIQVLVTTKGLADPDVEGEETSEAKFNSLDAAVEAALADDDLAGQLTELVDGLTILGIVDRGPDTDVEAIAWHSIREYEVYSCASDLES